MQIDDIMSPSPCAPVTQVEASLFVDHDDVLEEALDLMIEHGVNTLPVLSSDGYLVGTVSYRQVAGGLRGAGCDLQMAA